MVKANEAKYNFRYQYNFVNIDSVHHFLYNFVIKRLNYLQWLHLPKIIL